MSISLSRVFNKREERLIGRKSFWVMWEGLPAFGINITITSSHLDEMWFGARQPSSTQIVTQGWVKLNFMDSTNR